MRSEALAYPIPRQGAARRSHAPGARRALADFTGDALVLVAIAISVVLGGAMSVIDALLRPRRTARVARHLDALRMGGRNQLRELWRARALREHFRAMCALGLEAAVLRRIALRGNVAALASPVVLAIYHTPWGRLLGRWIAARGDIVLLADSHWASRAPGAHTPSSAAGMRRILQAVGEGRSAAITIDHFSEGGRVVRDAEVLGRRVCACTGAARIAARAGVPIVPVSFRWNRRRLEVCLGHRFSVSQPAAGAATAVLLAEFDRAVRADLSSWANAHRFLSLKR